MGLARIQGRYRVKSASLLQLEGVISHNYGYLLRIYVSVSEFVFGFSILCIFDDWKRLSKPWSLGPGPTCQLRRPCMVSLHGPDSNGGFNYREGDTFEQADWRCFCTVNGDILRPACLHVLDFNSIQKCGLCLQS